MKVQPGMVIVVGLGLGLLFVAMRSAAGAPPGTQTFTLSPGLFNLPAPAPGTQLAFVLPNGASGWQGATRMLAGQGLLSIASSAQGKDPLVVGGATAAVSGAAFTLQWLDGSGTPQTAVVTVT